jgi:hypothetical protein
VVASRRAGRGVIVGRGWAVPPAMPQDALWAEFFARHYEGSALAERIFARSGVITRHGVADPRAEDLSGWGTAARMERFVAEALPLGKEALTACLDDAGLATSDVDFLAVASCTGYATPGLDILLARDLGMPPAIQRIHIGHMGCYAALPALGTVADAAAARGQTGVLLCLELTSLHIQPATHDPQQMVAHALFSDAAAAVAVTPDGGAPPAAGGPATALHPAEPIARARNGFGSPASARRQIQLFMLGFVVECVARIVTQGNLPPTPQLEAFQQTVLYQMWTRPHVNLLQQQLSRPRGEGTAPQVA